MKSNAKAQGAIQGLNTASRIPAQTTQFIDSISSNPSLSNLVVKAENILAELITNNNMLSNGLDVLRGPCPADPQSKDVPAPQASLYVLDHIFDAMLAQVDRSRSLANELHRLL